MVIGVLFSGIIFGIFATLASLLMGAPLWVAILLYPVVGAFGAGAFIAMAALRSRVQNYGLSAAWQ